MASSISIPTAVNLGGYATEVATDQSEIGNYAPRLANAIIDVATAASADITALQAGTSIAAATTSAAGTMSAADKAALTRYVRGVVTSNVADLAAFTVASNDGLTYSAGQRVLLAGQTTAAQCGVYVVGTVGGGTAALTRATDMPASMAIQNGCIVEVSEGTVWAGSTWKAMCTGAAVVGTNDPVFYPRVCKYVAKSLTNGVVTIGNGGGSEPLYLWSTTLSSIHPTYNTPNTITLSVALKCAAADRTAGKAGTAAIVVKAVKADATTNTADQSTVDVTVTNW